MGDDDEVTLWVEAVREEQARAKDNRVATNAELIEALEHACATAKRCPYILGTITYPSAADYISDTARTMVYSNGCDDDMVDTDSLKIVMDFVMNRFPSLENEIADLQERLETRKLIERAKGKLMESQSLTEPQAFKWIQRAAMDRRTTMKAVAEVIIETLDTPAES